MILLNVLIALATFSTTLTATLFTIYQLEKRRRTTYAVKDGDVPVLEAQDRADAIVKNAAEKAKASLFAAEQEGTNLVEKYKQAQSQVEAEFGQQTDEIIKENKNKLLEKSREAEKTYAAALKALEDFSKEQILQKEKEIQGRINAYFTTIEDSLKAYTGDLKKRTQEVQMPFDQIKADLIQKITDTEKLYTDYIKSLEEKVNVSLVKNQNALDETRKTVEAKYLESESNYNDFLIKSEMKLSGSLEKSQVYLDSLKSSLETKDLETQKNYNDYLTDLKTKVEQSFAQNRKDLEEMKAGLGAKISQTEDSYAKFLKSLEDNMILDFNKKQQALDDKVNEFFGQTQEMLGKFLKELENRTQTQVEEEIGSAKKLIEEYKRQRLQIVDENLIAILEKTLNITLGKKLTLSDQTQLVYEALEEAKKENFFA